MAKDNVFYVDAKTKIVDFLTTQFVGFPPKLQNRFLNFFPSMSSYEEEGVKYRPKLLFTNNIESICRSLPNPSKLQLFDDANENMFMQRMKAIVPFCNSDWYIYVEVNNETNRIIYGIFKNVASIKDKLLEDIIFDNESIKTKANRVFAILVYAENNLTTTLKSLNGAVLNTNFALDIVGYNDIDNEIFEFAEAGLSKLKTTQKKLDELKVMFRNIFKNVLKDVHGTICMIVDKDYIDRYSPNAPETTEMKDDFLLDGIWLKTPVSLSKLFLRTDHYSEQKLISFAELLMTMLNLDGITVIDNTGNIIAYNLFVQTNSKTTGNIIGGARKRAAYTIINSRKKGIVGVYFQSMDGEMFYAPVKK